MSVVLEYSIIVNLNDWWSSLMFAIKLRSQVSVPVKTMKTSSLNRFQKKIILLCRSMTFVSRLWNVISTISAKAGDPVLTPQIRL